MATSGDGTVMAVFLALLHLIVSPYATHALMGYAEESSVKDVQALTGRIFTINADSPGHCSVECTQDPECVMFGYATSGKACQAYRLDLSDFTQNLVTQDSTTLYRALCGDARYTYVRSLSSCFKRHVDPRSWDDARTVCHNEMADLVTLSTYNKREYLREVLLNIESNPDYWIGGTQPTGDNSVWEWVDYTPLGISDDAWSFWADSEPSSSSEQCLGLMESNSDLAFRDEDCSNLKPFICEIQLM